MQEKKQPEREAPQQKAPYAPPAMKELGSLRELTRGGAVEQNGEGPGVSIF